MSYQEAQEPIVAPLSVEPTSRQTAVPPRLAKKLADYFIAEKGYGTDLPSEAAPLLDAADIVLSMHTGQMLFIVCIVDGEANPGKTFGLTADQARGVAQSCLKYTLARNGRVQFPVTISVIEIRDDPIYQRFEELKAFRKTRWFDKRILQASVVSPSGLHQSTQKALDQFVASVLKRPPLTAEDIAQYQRAAEIPTVRPVLTYGLLALLAAIFIVEVLACVGAIPAGLSPSPDSLVLFGGNIHSRTIDQGEFYRLWTSIFLHGGPEHLIFNGIALFLIGRALEALVGPTRLFAIFTIGGLCGSLASVFFNPVNLVSIGASGAIVGCFSALFVFAFHFPPGPVQNRLIRVSIQSVIPALLPFLNVTKGGTIDYADHAGGMVGGLIAGLLFLGFWRRTETRPQGFWIATLITIIGAAGALVGFAAVAMDYVAEARMINGLAPQSAFSNPIAQLPNSEALVKQYPLDPRSYLFYSAYLIEKGLFADAETAAKQGLDQKYALDQHFGPETRNDITALLAIAQAKQGRKADARLTAGTLCGANAKLNAAMKAQIARASVCSVP